MTKLDKALFAFASYNAALAAFPIAQGSRQARTGSERLVPQRGVCRREKVGAETVTYVANIYSTTLPTN